MSQTKITRSAVLKAIAEYDELGRAAFLTKYGYGEARSYVLVHEGRRYDSKAIAGVAHQWSSMGRPLTANGFNGGVNTVVKWLTKLGFTVEGVGSSTTSVWGLYCNPKKFDIDRLRQDGRELRSWTISQFKKAVAPGDRFVLLRSGDSGGLMAYGRFTGHVQHGLQGEEEYWQDDHGPADHVPLVIDEWVDPVIPRADLFQAASLQATTLYRMPGGALPHRLTDEAWRAVMKIVSDADKHVPHDVPAGTVKPARVMSTVQRVVRSSSVVRTVKEWHEHRCQVCEFRIEVPGGTFWSEGAHIQAIGSPYNGPDTTDNVLCLCPNCHVMFDNGVITLGDDLNVIRHGQTVDRLRTVEHHTINPTYVQSHRERWQR